MNFNGRGTVQRVQEWKLIKGFKVSVNINCQRRKHILHILFASEECYVGEKMKTKLADSVNMHRQQLRNTAFKGVPCNNSLNIYAQGKFKVFPLHKINEVDDLSRKAEGEYFIGVRN